MAYAGYMYQSALGTEEDFDKAFFYHKKAAELGNYSSMQNLGVLYQNGQGTEVNYSQAKFWYKKACDGGFTSACPNYENVKDY